MRHSTWEPDYYQENKQLKQENKILKQKEKIMEKKMYYIIDNDDTRQIVEPETLLEILKGEAECYNEKTNEKDTPQWNVTLTWMTEEEFNNLPEAD